MKYWFVGVLILGLFLFGCLGGGEKQLNYAASDASNIFVHSSNYTETGIDAQTSAVASAAVGTALASQPATAPYAKAGAVRTGVFLTCLIEKGVTKITLYTSKTDPFSVGIYAAGKEDTVKILSCLAIAAVGSTPLMAFGTEPPPDKYGLCSARLTVRTKDNNKFYIVFLGTSEKMCQTFCDSQVNGCVWSNDIGYQWIYNNE